LLTCSILTHESRVPLAHRLAGELADLRPSIVLDTTSSGGNLKAALEAWAQHGRSGYHLVLQDDAVPVPGFIASAYAACRVARGAAVCFWMRPWHPDAHRHKRAPLGTLTRVATYREWPPTVALALPSDRISGLLDHAAACHRRDRYDDKVVGCYLTQASIPLVACSPSIVEHDATIPSVLNGRSEPHRTRSRTYLAIIAPLSWTAE
jgi:hypothetical protein